ncbi:PAS domain-containing sensor histidine kinase [Natrinema salinisoli]|uniref:PAS domain-containing sensor histidine kinase n=1 Tax=Natrinema salinisoli TaxID=2878535 RepID=UPI001CEFD054|nr:PAS domain S-box protein [Natrinema salinisoli]
MSKRADAAEAIFWADEVDDSVAIQRYQTLVNTVDDGIYQLDTDGRFVAVNDIIVEMSGYARDELLGEHVSILLADDDVERIAREIERSVANDDRLTETFEIAARTAADETRYCELRVSLLVEDSDFQGSVGIVRDVTDRKRTEETLDEHERQLERERDLIDRILETSPVGVQVLDTDGRVTRMNERIREILEIPEDETGEYDPSDRTVYDENGREVTVDEHPFTRTLETGDPVYEEILRVELPSGDSRWLSVNAAPVFNDAGEIDRVVTTGEDITALKERERELETELDEIFGRISDAFYAVDDQFRFTHVNERAAEFMGRTRDELLGRNVWDVFPEAADSPLSDRFRDAMESQEPVSFERYSEPFGIWAEVNAYPSETGLSVYFRDITERKERERKLRESERRSRTLVEHFPNGAVALFDEKLQYTTVGGEIIEDLEDSADEIVGQDILERYPEELADRLEPKYRAALAGERSTFEFEFRDRHWYAHTVPVEDDEGDVSGGMVMVQDITDRKEAERDLRESEAKFRTVTENLDEIVWMMTPDTEEFLYVNPAYEEVYGRDREALYEDPYAFAEALHPEDRDRVLDAWAKLPEEEYEEEFRIVRPDGEVRWVNARTAEANDESREVTRIVGIAEDVTERKERERELETLFEVLPVGVVVAEADGEIVEANDTARAIWGGDVFDASSVDEYERYPVRWADSGERVEPEEMTLARVVNGEAVTDSDIFEIDAVDGERLIVELEGMPIRDEAGEVTRGVVTLSDITERRTAQRRLAESERRYRTLAEHFPNGVVGVYDRDLRYTLAAGEKIGDPAPSKEEVEGARMPELYPDDAVADLEPLFRAAIEDGETGSVQTEVVGRHWQVWATPLRDADGEIFAGLSFAQDITERKARKRELERALDLLEKTERIADVGGWEIDTETRDVFWTDHIFELLAVDGDEEPPLEEAIDMYHEKDQPIVEAAVEEALASGESFDVEVRVHTESGEMRWLRLQGVPETDDGHVVSLRGAAHDITEHKKRERRLEKVIERLEESNERLEQFAYAASHDLQEPLRMVSSYLQLLESRYADDLEEDAQEFVEFAVDGAERMRAMIDGLLKYSRVETQGEPLEPVELGDVLDEVRDDLQLTIERSGAEITAEELPPVEGDASQLRQVFQNLLENAIEYSGDAAPRIHVSAERDGPDWVVSVRDEGIGIDTEDANRIFDVFQRLHSREEYSGTGIGLALCERIVERHGGDIWVESEPGEGSTFSFTLPSTDA